MNANTLRSRKGFTLIELMIVVVIIGILAAIAIPRFAGVGQQARQSEAEPILAQIHTLQEAHFERYNTYGSLDDLARVGYSAPQNVQYFSIPAVLTSTQTAYCAEMLGDNENSGTTTMRIGVTRADGTGDTVAGEYANDSDGQPVREGDTSEGVVFCA